MKKIFAELNAFRLELLCVLVSVAAGVGATLGLPTYLSDIINRGIADKDMNYILHTGVIMLGIAILGMVCNITTGFFASRIALGLGRNVRSRIFTKVEYFSQAEIDTFSTASLITRTNNDITQVQNFMVMFLRVILTAPIMCVVGIMLAYSKNPKMSSILVVSMPVMVLIISLIGRRAMPLSRKMQTRIDRINLIMREKLSGIRVIRAFGTEDYEEKRFDGANKDLMNNAMKMMHAMSLLGPSLILILNLTVVGLLWRAGQGIGTEPVMPGDILAIIQYVMQIMMSVTMLSMIFVMYPRCAASADRICEVLDTENSIGDPAVPKLSDGQRGYLTFRDVSFYFPGAKEPAVSHVSFEAKPGETTAIIGSTGSGKTALVGLIPRFYDVQEGEVLVDGVNVKDYDRRTLRRKIGYVPQKALLFKGTIMENIRFGDDSASDERVKEAAAIAQSTDFIEDKPDGFDSSISQGGSNVSGGQRQRLAIARAIVRKPEIYVFDDSFSALDFKTDSALRQALSKETGNATVVIVAQRVSTIMNADRIIVMDEGKVMGIGTHRELLNTCGTYQEIVRSQLSEEEMSA